MAYVDNNLPALVTPAGKVLRAGGGDEPLPVRYIGKGDWDLGAFAFNIFSAAVIFAAAWFLIACILFALGFHFFAISTITSTCIVWVIIINAHERLWTEVGQQKGVIFLDRLFSKKLTVYEQGFHFVKWSAYQQKDQDLDFQKQESLVHSAKSGNAIVVPTADGYHSVVDLAIFLRRECGALPVSWTLRYKNIDEIRARTLAVTQERVSALFALNSFDVLTNRKAEVTEWIATLFDGPSQSRFEKETGTKIDDPIIVNIDLTDDDRVIYAMEARAQAVLRTSAQLQAKGMSPEKADLAAQALMGSVTRNVFTIDGVPDGVTTLIVGDAGLGGLAAGVAKTGKKGPK